MSSIEGEDARERDCDRSARKDAFNASTVASIDSEDDDADAADDAADAEADASRDLNLFTSSSAI